MKTWSQERDRSIKQQLEVLHDNDFLLLTDRYYSSGIHISYRRILSKPIFKGGDEQLDFTLSQEAHTPAATTSENIADFDRPYAGFSGLKSGWSTSTDQSILKVNVVLGMAGPASGAGNFQRWYHNAVVISDAPIWVSEIENNFHSNLDLYYSREWQLSPNPFSVRLALQPSAAVGTKDIYVEPKLAIYFGRRNSVNNSIAYSRIGSVREIYFAIHTAYRYVGHNGLLEGHLFGDDSVLLVPSKSSVYRFGFDFYHRSGQNDYKVGYQYISPETTRAGKHQYLSLSYARSF